MPISRRRAKVASRMVLPICSAEASSSRTEAPAVDHCSTFSARKNGSSSWCRSWTFWTPLSPTTELTTPWYSSGLRSLTRNDSCIWSISSESWIGLPSYARWNSAQASAWSRSRSPSGRHLRVGLQGGPDGVLLRLGDVLARLALVAAGVLGAQEDRDLDLVVPAALHQVDLLAGQQAGAEQRQRHPHGHDHGQGHGQVLAQPGAGLGQDVAETHAGLPRRSGTRAYAGRGQGIGGHWYP